MTSDPGQTDDLLHRISAGDRAAFIELFAQHRDRLRRMVRLRLDHRLQGRIDPSDVLQEAQIDILRRAGSMPPTRPCRRSSGCGSSPASGSRPCTAAISGRRCAMLGRKFRCATVPCPRRPPLRWPRCC